MTSPSEARAAAEAQVQAYCRWHIAPVVDATVVLDGPGSGALTLPSLRVVSITSITEDGQVLDPDTYSWSKAGLVRRSASTYWQVWNQPRWTTAYQAIAVEFTHGYDDWPLEVAALIDRLATRAVEGSSVLSQVGAVSYATGEDGAPLSANLGSMDKAVLDAYRLPWLP